MSDNLIPENVNTTQDTENKSASETAETQAASEAEAATKTEETATTAVVKIEGQDFPLDVSIADDDDLLKTALSPHYPSIKNAQISREIRAGQMIVSIVKKAEHKGIGWQA